MRCVGVALSVAVGLLESTCNQQSGRVMLFLGQSKLWKDIWFTTCSFTHLLFSIRHAVCIDASIIATIMFKTVNMVRVFCLAIYTYRHRCVCSVWQYVAGGACTVGPGIMVEQPLSENIRHHVDLQKETPNSRHVQKALKFYTRCSHFSLLTSLFVLHLEFF